MHILHVLDHSIPLHSGYTFRTRSIIREQRKLGWVTNHITGPKHNLQYEVLEDVETIDGLTFFRTKPSKSLLHRLPILNQIAVVSELKKSLLKVAKELHPDILHAHSPALNGLAALAVGKQLNIPVIYEIRAFWEDAAVDHGTSKEWGIRYRLTRAMETRVVKRAMAVTTICDGLRKDIIARGVAANKVTVIPNAVDLEQFGEVAVKDHDLLDQLNIKNRKVIAFIGSFYAYEGLPLLIEAFPAIIKKYSDAILLLVGGGPDESKLKSLVKKINIENHVIFTGRVPHEKINSYYSIVDIFVYPRYMMRLTNLVTPLKPLEAMAQRKIVVASDVGGHKELIDHGHNGVLFKAGNVSSLTESIDLLLANSNTWEDYRDAGASYVRQERNWTKSVSHYRGVYNSVVGRHAES